jgi:uncharacterized protein (DUF849 family)
MNKKVILTCAITGSATSIEQTQYLPVSPEQIAKSGLEAAEAGASVLHIHVRDPHTAKPSMNLEYYQEVVQRIREKNKNVLLNLTTGPGATGPSNVVFGKTYQSFCEPHYRVEHVIKLRPDICTLDLNVMNRGNDNITVNSVRVAREMAGIIKAAGVKPELEIFDSGDLHIAKMLIDEGIIENSPLWQICTGVKWGWQSSVDTLEYAKKLLPQGANWCAFGIGVWQMPFVALSTISGGNARVGLEDNIYIEKGVLAKSNKELVEKAVRIIKDIGGSVATATEARDILKIKQRT